MLLKKWMAALLTLVMLMSFVSIPAMADQTLMLVNKNGVELVYTKYRFFEGDDTIFLVANLNAVNSNDFDIYIDSKNASVDGVAVSDLGFTMKANTKFSNSEKSFMFLPDEQNYEKSANALRNAQVVEFDLAVRGGSPSKELFQEHISFRLDGSASTTGSSRSSSEEKVDFGHGSGSSAKTAPAYTPQSTEYKELKKGNSGQPVKDLQQRLTDLGYFTDKVNGSFGVSTSVAVMSFCTQNGLFVQPVATIEMQQLLYSSRAQYYVEPYIPLVIGPESRWKSNTRNDVGTLNVQLVNRSNRQIRGFEIYFYRTNVWDEKVYDDDGGWLYKSERIQTYKPGVCQYCNNLVFGYFAYTYKVWVGIHKIVFDDGEIREIPYDDIQFFGCKVKKD